MQMIAKKTWTYRGRRLSVGDKFDVTDRSHARQLRAYGVADDAEGAAAPRRRGRPRKAEVEHNAEQTYETRVLTAED